jgi:YD repeat-containing protein
LEILSKSHYSDEIKSGTMAMAQSTLVDRPLTSVIVRRVLFFALGALLFLCSTERGFGQAETVTYTYDNLNRLTRTTYSGGRSIIYTYDAAGNRTSIQVLAGGAAPPFGINSVNGVIPQTGRATGGQQIKLSGSFTGLSTVIIGGVSASWTFSNGTSEVTVTTPAHAVGGVSIDLLPTSGSTYSKSNAFAYLPTTFTDDILTVGQTTAKAQHIIELRQAIDALRAVAGLGAAPWTDVVLVPIGNAVRAVHIQELRTYLDNAAALLGYPTQPYMDPSLTSGFTVKKVHIEELRQRIRNIAG